MEKTPNKTKKTLPSNLPCIVFAKSNCYFNRKFCLTLGIKKVGDRLSYSFVSSKLSKYKFGIKITRNGPHYAIYGRNRQLACGVKSLLNKKGFVMSKSVYLNLKHITKGGRIIWWFIIPESTRKTMRFE